MQIATKLLLSTALATMLATVTLPCGPQTITFTQYDGTRTLQDWEFRVDNVTAVCVDPVASEACAWSRVKALYR